jgi:hypothetical protein
MSKTVIWKLIMKYIFLITSQYCMEHADFFVVLEVIRRFPIELWEPILKIFIFSSIFFGAFEKYDSETKYR